MEAAQTMCFAEKSKLDRLLNSCCPFVHLDFAASCRRTCEFVLRLPAARLGRQSLTNDYSSTPSDTAYNIMNKDRKKRIIFVFVQSNRSLLTEQDSDNLDGVWWSRPQATHPIIVTPTLNNDAPDVDRTRTFHTLLGVRFTFWVTIQCTIIETTDVDSNTHPSDQCTF